MYIYHARINALSAHIIHIKLNTMFYTHVDEPIDRQGGRLALTHKHAYIQTYSEPERLRERERGRERERERERETSFMPRIFRLIRGIRQ